MLTLIGAAMLALAASAHGDTRAEPLVASSKWTADWEGDLCVLQRQYGEGAGAVVVGFRPIPLSNSLELVLLSLDDDRRYRHGRATISLGPSEAKEVGAFQSFAPSGTRQRITTIYTGFSVEEMIKSDELRIAGTGLNSIDIAPGGSTHAAAALGACQDDVLSRWGVDPQAVHALTRQPEMPIDIGLEFQPGSYPAMAVKLHKQGRSVALLAIGSDGRVIGCRTIVSAGFDALDQRTCEIGSRVRYRPGVGTDGAPTKSWIALPVHWMLP